MARFSRFLAALFWMLPAVAIAGPAEDANTILNQWSAAYSTNEPEAVTSKYWPDAILLGTVGPVISQGSEAILKYFTPLKGSGNKNAIEERHAIPIDDNAVLLTGFYEFTRIEDGKPVPFPARYTMLITKRGGEWRIMHHHSSPHVQPKQ
jgi:uncharacterized protein (TIGR02246 family)